MSRPTTATVLSSARPETSAEAVCPCCADGRLQVFHEFGPVPTNSCILLSRQEDALNYPRGMIRLALCSRCGFVSNTTFDPTLTEYSHRYEETQAFSPTFSAFHEKLARTLIARHGLQGKDIIEIGCGKGEFLGLLCSLGDNRGLGFDPGYNETRGQQLTNGRGDFDVVRDFFSDTYTNRQADLVCCKMTLEHIPAPHRFMQTAVKVARQPDGTIFVQVPESLRIFRDCAFEDIYYEHCSYFTAASLTRLFTSLGFEPIHTEVSYGGQYLTVEARPGRTTSNGASKTASPDELVQAVKTFPTRMAEHFANWGGRLREWKQRGSTVVIWGSGSKGVSFLTTVPDADVVAFAVDVNPYRRGYFMPGTGQKILSPTDLPAIKPDVVIVMNRVYENEIRDNLDTLGLRPEMHAL